MDFWLVAGIAIAVVIPVTALVSKDDHGYMADLNRDEQKSRKESRTRLLRLLK